MKILKNVQKVPGGNGHSTTYGATLNTFTPQALEIGGFTTALFKNGALLIALFVLCNGAQINI